MTTEKQSNVYWLGEYAKKHPEELTSYKYCVVDGFCWTTATDGRLFCAGPVEKIKRRLAGDNGVDTDATETNPPRVEGVGQNSKVGETTTLDDGEAKDHSFVPLKNATEKKKLGRPKKESPAEIILQMSAEGLGSRQISLNLHAEGVDISYKTVQRVLSGQRALIL